jgi:hypothetical protein
MMCTILLLIVPTFALSMLVGRTGVTTGTNYTSSASVLVYVDPQNSTGTLGQSFKVNISVSSVTDLYGWEFTLEWNATVLSAVSVGQGSFLNSSGPTYFPDPQINNTVGYVTAYCTLLGNIPGVNGNGTLASIEFLVETTGECTLNFTNTMLVNSADGLIAQSAVDGYFYTSGQVGLSTGGARVPYLQ